MTGRVDRVIIIALANNIGKNESIIHGGAWRLGYSWRTLLVFVQFMYHTTSSRRLMRAHLLAQPESSRKRLSNISVEDNRSLYRGHEKRVSTYTYFTAITWHDFKGEKRRWKKHFWAKEEQFFFYEEWSPSTTQWSNLFRLEREMGIFLKRSLCRKSLKL